MHPQATIKAAKPNATASPPAVAVIALVISLVISLAWSLAPRPVGAADEIYSVSGIEVDATAASAQRAQTEAITAGQSRALRELLTAMTREQDHPRLPKVTDDLVGRVLKSFEVEDERRSSQRYRARLTVHFMPDRVRDLLIARDVPFAEAKGGPILVLPVMRDGPVARLWDEPNPWRDAWLNRERRFGLLEFVLPLGELADVAILDVDQALAGDEDRILALSRRYGTTLVLVAVAEPVVDAISGHWAVDVDVRRHGMMSGPWVVERLVVPSAADAESALAAAARMVIERMESAWRTDNLLFFGQEAEVTVEFRAETLDQWLAVKKILEDVSRVRAIAIDAISKRAVRVTLTYLGELPQLASALSNRNLQMAEDGGQLVLEFADPALRADPMVPTTGDPTRLETGEEAPPPEPAAPALPPPAPGEMLVE